MPSRSHDRTVVSLEPLRMRWPSGIAATARTGLVCPTQVLRGSASDVPHLDEPVPRATDDVLAVKGHRHVVDHVVAARREGVTSVPRRGTRTPLSFRPTTKCSVGHRNDGANLTLHVAHVHVESALERRRASTASRSRRPSRDEARSARKHRGAVDVSVVRVDGALENAVVPHLERLSREQVTTRPSRHGSTRVDACGRRASPPRR